MVTVFLRGGLGNQMFQYAAGLGIAKKQNIGLELDTTFLADRFPRKKFTYRTYDLDVFDIKPKFTLFSDVSAQMPIPGLWLGLDLACVAASNMIGAQKLVKEKEERVFDSSVMDAGANIVLWGFWQNKNYFNNAISEVRAAFRFRTSDNEVIIKAKKEIADSNAVSVHVRRGDFLAVHGGTDVSYFQRAIAYIAERVASPTFYVFSDDLAWCRENIKTPTPAVFMDAATAGYKASGHLELMSLCKHNIIANSSFSWWGAWLNENPDKIVVGPERWKAGTNWQEDLFPAGWVIL